MEWIDIQPRHKLKPCELGQLVIQGFLDIAASKHDTLFVMLIPLLKSFSEVAAAMDCTFPPTPFHFLGEGEASQLLLYPGRLVQGPPNMAHVQSPWSIWLLSCLQGFIFRSENDIYSPPPFLKMIFFPPLATRRFLTPIVVFLPYI